MKFDSSRLRLYAVTDRSWTGRQSLYEQVEEALKGGITLLQLREKNCKNQEFLEEAVQMVRLCHRYGVPLIINDNVWVAVQSGADGVHIGQGDEEAGEVRRLLGPDRILGVTAKTAEQAKDAKACGADYIGSGAVFGSATKTDASYMDLVTLKAICDCVDIPVAAIGGINEENMELLKGTGIEGVAVVSALFSSADIRKTAGLMLEKSKKLVEEGV